MNILLIPVVALLMALMICITLIPLMVRLAPRFGMIDQPDPRKVHATPIPRVGGIGIAASALCALALFCPWNSLLLAFMLGSTILIFFGAWDDMKQIGHYPKFIGQMAAAALIIWLGDVWVEHLPFLDQALPASIGKPFTMIAIIGVINAINHSDGLDGLAGGESLLSLAAMSFLAFLSGNLTFIIMSAAICGGILGFLRFNSWPARVFMGDVGSQFLGFGVAVFAILLTQKVNASASKAIPLLLIGLPVIDILAVLYQRIQGGKNWFLASKNHVHHRLLERKLDHYQAVMVIYAIQILLTFGAVALAYESDGVVLLWYAIVCTALFAALTWAEKKGWYLRSSRPSWPARIAASLNEHSLAVQAPLYFIKISLPIYVLASSLMLVSTTVFSLIGWLAALPLMLLVLLTLSGPQRVPTLYRMAMFCTIAILIYCHYALANLTGAPENLRYSLSLFSSPLAHALDLGYFAVLALCLGWTGWLLKDEFKATPMDFLIVTGLITAAIFSSQLAGLGSFWVAIIKMTILFYGCEIFITDTLKTRSGTHWNRILSASAAGALGIVFFKLIF